MVLEERKEVRVPEHGIHRGGGGGVRSGESRLFMWAASMVDV
jgi:hypothetical protein